MRIANVCIVNGKRCFEIYPENALEAKYLLDNADTLPLEKWGDDSLFLEDREKNTFRILLNVEMRK